MAEREERNIKTHEEIAEELSAREIPWVQIKPEEFAFPLGIADLSGRWRPAPAVERMRELLEQKPFNARARPAFINDLLTTPHFKLFCAITGERNKSFRAQPADRELILVSAIENNLKKLPSLFDRQQEILRLRFGLDFGYKQTLEDVGDQYGVTRERIRQEETRLIRILRHPKYYQEMRDFFPYDENSLVTRLFNISYQYEIPRSLGDAYNLILTEEARDELKELNVNALNVRRNFYELDLNSISTASQLAIKLAFLADYVNLAERVDEISQENISFQNKIIQQEKDLLRVRRKLGEIPLGSDYSDTIDVLDLTVRSYNVLRRNGIQTVAQLKDTDPEKLSWMRNLGPVCYKDITTKLEKYLASSKQLKLTYLP